MALEEASRAKEAYWQTLAQITRQRALLTLTTLPALT